MAKEYLRGLLMALIWWALGLTILYAAAWWADEPPHMGWFCLAWLAAWPLAAGFYAGWHDAGHGFGAGRRAVTAPLLLMAAAWWWLLPELWQPVAAGTGALYALATALLGGGLGAGFHKARLKLYPPPPPPPDDDTPQ